MQITRRQLRRLIKEELQKSGSDYRCHGRSGAKVTEKSAGNYHIQMPTTQALKCRGVYRSSGGKIKLTLERSNHSGYRWEIVSKNPFSVTAGPQGAVEEVNTEPYQPNGVYGFEHYKVRGELTPKYANLELTVSEKDVELYIKTSGGL